MKRRVNRVLRRVEIFVKTIEGRWKIRRESTDHFEVSAREGIALVGVLRQRSPAGSQIYGGTNLGLNPIA
jgi:hypothetical protein